MNKTIPGLIVVLILLAGCVPPQPPRMEQDLAEMKRRLAASEQAVVALRKDLRGGAGDTRLETVTRNQADVKADLDALRGDILAQQGTFDEFRANLQRQQEQLEQLRDELDFKIKAIEERLAKLEAAPAAAPAPAPPSSAEELYQQGLDVIRSAADYPRGRRILGDFVAKHPEHPLVVNARYWIGEAWYGEKKYENAILQFQDVIQDYDDHPKVAAALLKQALSFEALGDKDNTRIILGKVVERFPLSAEAKKAKELLGE